MIDDPTFWSKVTIGDGCWEWQGCTTKKGGHGMITRRRRGYVAVSTARYAIDYFGPLHVLHHCDNPRCCRPSHLFLGTHVENMRDKGRKGRGRNHNSKPLSS